MKYVHSVHDYTVDASDLVGVIYINTRSTRVSVKYMVNVPYMRTLVGFLVSGTWVATKSKVHV